MASGMRIAKTIFNRIFIVVSISFFCQQAGVSSLHGCALTDTNFSMFSIRKNIYTAEEIKNISYQEMNGGHSATCALKRKTSAIKFMPPDQINGDSNDKCKQKHSRNNRCGPGIYSQKKKKSGIKFQIW